uniref:hypothetical protein n=1 Tax=Pseudodesulfovibrio sp. TaxID=2035812 RepID=UPI00257A3746|nr:hypothetical protein [Pseudodesulfovibrio sp.]
MSYASSPGTKYISAMMSKSKRFVGFSYRRRLHAVRSKTGRFKLFGPVLSTLTGNKFQNYHEQRRTLHATVRGATLRRAGLESFDSLPFCHYELVP